MGAQLPAIRRLRPDRPRTRRYRAGLEPIGKLEPKATARSAINRRFVAGTSRKLASAIPGACVVMVAVITSTMLGQRATLAEHAAMTARHRQSAPTARPGRRSKRGRQARSTNARQSPDGAPARARLQELLVEQPALTAGEAAPLIDRSPSRARALLAELRSEGAR